MIGAWLIGYHDTVAAFPEAEVERLLHYHQRAGHVAAARGRGRSTESAALSAALRKAGFVFVGPTLYAFMKAIGMVDSRPALPGEASGPPGP